MLLVRGGLQEFKLAAYKEDNVIREMQERQQKVQKDQFLWWGWDNRFHGIKGSQIAQYSGNPFKAKSSKRLTQNLVVFVSAIEGWFKVF